MKTRAEEITAVSPGRTIGQVRASFSFSLDGDAHHELSTWSHSERVSLNSGCKYVSDSYRDPNSGLTVEVESTVYEASDAVGWTLRFTNQGTEPSALIQMVKPLDITIDTQDSETTLHYALGSEVSVNDFENRSQDLPLGGRHRLASMNGRSSRNHLPFFNLQTGDKGVLGAIGWTGNWHADFERDFSGNVHLLSGMPVTRFRLAPGESVRTPRVLIMGWEGSREDSQNKWRRLLLSEVIPQESGAPVELPSFYCVWGTSSEAWHLSKIDELVSGRTGIGGYWIDAGWYGDEPLIEKGSVLNTNWSRNRGSWRPSPECYPNGLAPITDRLRESQIQSMVWFEPEIADPGSDLLREHPEWFLQLPGHEWGLINLGDPIARDGITDLVSGVLADNSIDWYRQDFNTDPEMHWKAADSPDRIGITEMLYVEGLYTFWDSLRERNPGLRIDNCSSGGRRIDLETLARSIPLWRSDCVDVLASQNHTAGLAPWAPLSAGVVLREDIYELRSAYSAGLIFEGGMSGPNYFSPEWLQSAQAEFEKVRPFYYGDYYPVNPHFYFDAHWIVWQYHRPDLKSGMVMAFRRGLDAPLTFDLDLRAIDGHHQYSVEIHRGFEPEALPPMSGASLSQLQIESTTLRSSMILFYSESHGETVTEGEVKP